MPSGFTQRALFTETNQALIDTKLRLSTTLCSLTIQ